MPHTSALPLLLCILLGFLAPGLQAETVSLTGGKGFDAFSFQGEQHDASRSVVSVEHPAISDALRVEVPKSIPQIHQVQVNFRNHTPIMSGDVVLVRITLRSAAGADSRVASQLFVQDSLDGFRSIAGRKIEAGEGWEEIDLIVPITQDYASKQINFALMFGEAAQTVEIARFEAWNLGPRPDESELARLRASAIIHHDFEGAFLPLPEPSPASSAITGSVPAGWDEDSAWADVDVKYGPTTANPHSGKQSFSINASAIRSGAVQFRLPEIGADPAYQMVLRGKVWDLNLDQLGMRSSPPRWKRIVVR